MADLAGQLESLRPQAGDLLILRLRHVPTEAEQEVMSAALQEWADRYGCHAVMLTDGITLEALSDTDLASIGLERRREAT